VRALLKIGEIANLFDVSTRTVRYYEEVGLLTSHRDPDSQYRYYDERSSERLKKILVLRELGLSLNDIKIILDRPSTPIVSEILLSHLLKVQDEIKRQKMLEKVLKQILNMLDSKLSPGEIINTLEIKSPGGINILKEDYKMEQLTNSDIRIIRLKPTKIAAYRAKSESPEADSLKPILEWANKEDIMDLPTTRLFGFDTAVDKKEYPVYGYESWISVPDDCKIPDTLEEKYLQGGLYAVTNTTYGNFDVQKKWQMLSKWFEESEFEYGGQQCLEEILMIETIDNPSKLQLDLFIHIKE